MWLGFYWLTNYRSQTPLLWPWPAIGGWPRLSSSHCKGNFWKRRSVAHEHGFSGMVLAVSHAEYWSVTSTCYCDQKSVFVFLHMSKVVGLNVRHARFYTIISRERLFILTGIYVFNCPPVIGAVPTDKPWESWIVEKVTSSTRQLKNGVWLRLI